MRRGQTHQEVRYGKPPGSEELLSLWNDSLTDKLLQIVWNAYDLKFKEWSKQDWSDKHYDDLERSLSEELEIAIQRCMDGYLPVDVQYSPAERESRADPPAKPPEYDIAFKWRDDPRIMWPLEAKVLKSDTVTDLKDYVETIQQRFLTGYYAPFSNGGAMLAYLKSGFPESVCRNIETKLSCTLSPHTKFSVRCHKTSDHSRKIPSDKNYPIEFRCHHLIMPLSTVPS